MRNSQKLFKRIPQSNQYQRWSRFYDTVIHLAPDDSVGILIYPRPGKNTVTDIMMNLKFGCLEKFGLEIFAKTSLEGLLDHETYVEVLIGELTGNHPLDNYLPEKIKNA
jgi:hypothetical protein